MTRIIVQLIKNLLIFMWNMMDNSDDLLRSLCVTINLTSTSFVTRVHTTLLLLLTNLLCFLLSSRTSWAIAFISVVIVAAATVVTAAATAGFWLAATTRPGWNMTFEWVLCILLNWLCYENLPSWTKMTTSKNTINLRILIVVLFLWWKLQLVI